jgi:serine/threonine-protein kinase PknG
MAEQLLGVLREIVALRDGSPRPAVSSLFTGDQLVTHGVLEQGVSADWRLLPALKADPADPAATFLLGAVVTDPGKLADFITMSVAQGLVPESQETNLRLARANIERGRYVEADAALDHAQAADAKDWRVWWYRGVIALATGLPATEWFDPVATAVPGELPPKLALALAAELSGDLPRAIELYDVVSRVDPTSFTSAVFGLARARLAAGDRAGAVEAYTRVPQSSSVYLEAQVDAARALIRATHGEPTMDDLVQASTTLQRLSLDARDRIELEREVYEAALGLVTAGKSNGSRAQVLGENMDEMSLRRGLERSYRNLARLAPTAGERIELVDRANAVRPRTLV